jgi:ABC-2 type transport system ATP-binding protein
MPAARALTTTCHILLTHLVIQVERETTRDEEDFNGPEAAMTTPIVEAVGLTKRFGKVQALDGLDLVAPAGQVLAILGPNGAGKTTFVRMVATLLRPDSGRLRVAGVDVLRQPAEARKLVGLAGQFAAVEDAMTGRENLAMIARLFGHSRGSAAANSRAVLELMDLTEDADRWVKTYSGGMRRRLDLGASLVGTPRLLLLDEPTTGLDPRSRIQLWDAIRELVAAGTDVLLTTQYLEEADELAHQVVIIDNGRVIAKGSPHELKTQVGGDVVEVRAGFSDQLAPLASALASLGAEAPRIDQATRRVTVPVTGGTSSVIAAVRALDQLGLAVDDIALRRPTLYEVFLALTGQPIEGRHNGPSDERQAALASAGNGRHV